MSQIEVLRKPLDSVIYEEHKTFFDATRDILDFSDTVIAELNGKGMTPALMTQFEKVLLAWFFRQTLLGEQAWLLASGSQEVGTAILVRSMAEIRIKLEYLLHKGPKQFEVLSEEFFQYGDAVVLRTARIGLEICERNGDSQVALDLKQKIDVLERHLGDKQRPNQWWPGKTVVDLARDSNGLSFYKTVFGPCSADVHSQPANMFRDHSDPSLRRWVLHPSPKSIPTLLYTIYDCYQMMLRVVACQFWGHPFERFDDFVARRSELERLLDQHYN